MRESFFPVYYCNGLSFMSLQSQWWIQVVCQARYVTYVSEEWSHERADTCDTPAVTEAQLTAGWILLLLVFTTEKSGEVTFCSPFIPPTISLLLTPTSLIRHLRGEAWETVTSLFLWHKDPLWDPFTISFYRTRVGTALVSILNMWTNHPLKDTVLA